MRSYQIKAGTKVLETFSAYDSSEAYDWVIESNSYTSGKYKSLKLVSDGYIIKRFNNIKDELDAETQPSVVLGTSNCRRQRYFIETLWVEDSGGSYVGDSIDFLSPTKQMALDFLKEQAPKLYAADPRGNQLQLWLGSSGRVSAGMATHIATHDKKSDLIMS